MPMYERFKENIIEKGLLKEGEGLVLGISGGPDSICMLSLFIRLMDEWDLRLVPVHLNHMLRGEDSQKDALFVSEFCRQNGLECISHEIDVARMSEEWKISLEEAGRKIRYGLFASAAKEKGCSRIALGQNLNDQAETIMMRIMRGTGLKGLSGIEHIRDGVFIRPILIFTRDEIESYCRDKGLKPRTDLTNLEPVYTRNKIRLELLPYIEKNFNKRISESLFRMGDMLREDGNFIECAAEEEFEKIAKEKKDGAIEMSRDGFNGIHKAVRARVLRHAVKKVKGNLVNVTGERVSAALEAIERDSNNRTIEFPGFVDVLTSGGMISVRQRETDAQKVEFEYSLKMGETLCVEETGDLVKTEKMPFKEEISGSSDPWTVFIDAGKVRNESLKVRNRRDGDRFSPLGMNGTKKLKDFMIDEKIDKARRDSVLLLCDGDEIVWVAGHRMSDLYKVEKGTENLLEITVAQACYEK